MPEAPDAWRDLAELIEISRPTTPPPPKPRRDWRLAWRILWLAVVPTALSILYFDVIAVDRFVSEARFVVREPNFTGRLMLGASSGLTQLPKNSGDEDSYAVKDFIQSRDALALLERDDHLRALLAPAAPDPAWRFPSLLLGNDGEDLYRYYRRLVTLDYDTTTNVSTLTVQGFRAGDAERMATTLLGGAEALLNQMNERARRDAIRVAEAEVAASHAAALAAQDAVTAYRTREHVVDPLEFSKTMLTTITQLTEELVNAAADIDVAIHASPHSPQIGPLQARVAALQAEIDHERAALAGSDGSLAPRIAAYERLVLERSFAEERYVSALTLLESAHLDAERQAAYLELVVAPHAADQPRYPHRVLWPVVTFGAGLLLAWLFRPTAPLAPDWASKAADAA
jgi:capsular polysaccharide transport system permease protein